MGDWFVGVRNAAASVLSEAAENGHPCAVGVLRRTLNTPDTHNLTIDILHKLAKKGSKHVITEIVAKPESPLEVDALGDLAEDECAVRSVLSFVDSNNLDTRR